MNQISENQVDVFQVTPALEAIQNEFKRLKDAHERFEKVVFETVKALETSSKEGIGVAIIYKNLTK